MTTNPLPEWLDPDADVDGSSVERESNVDLTPDLARQLLATVGDDELATRSRYSGGMVTNTDDGKVRIGKRVSLFTELIETGRFHGADQAPIKIGWDGKLWDGVARCQAVAFSGRTVKVEVARNVPPGRVLQESDMHGKKRTDADLLESWHAVPRHLCGPMSRAGRRALYLHWQTENWGQRGVPKLRPILPGYVMKYLSNWGIEDVIDLAQLCEAAQDQWGCESRVLLAPLLVANHPDVRDGMDLGIVNDFLNGFIKQVGLYEGDPRIALINYYKDRDNTRKKVQQDYSLEIQERWIKNCWNHFLTGEPLSGRGKRWSDGPPPVRIMSVSEYNDEGRD